jgi:hypothetical protein
MATLEVSMIKVLNGLVKLCDHGSWGEPDLRP